jgi:uncharacterized surface protein with fasciclin (FAS1) repeats
MKQKTVSITLALVLMLATFSLVSAQDVTDNVVDIVAKTDNLSTLHTAIVEAELADTLASADSSYTVFAPTNAAFGALPEGLLDALLADPEGALTDVLLYHVVPGKLDSTAVIAAGTLTTVGGETLTVEVREGDVYVNDSKVILADIPAKNGVIHTISEVLVPPAIAALPSIAEISAPPSVTSTMPDVDQAEVVTEMDGAATEAAAPTMTIAEIAAANGNFEVLLSAAELAGLDDELASPGNYTVFAPTDDAFAAVPEEFLNFVLGDVEGQLTPILLYHIVNDQLNINQIANSSLIPTLDGRPLFVTTGEGNSPVYVNGAQIIMSNIQASNGVIHVIDAVLVP